METILFKNQHPKKLFVKRLPEYLQRCFNADGMKSIPSVYRSPWLDEQESKRKGNRRDFICNCLAVPLGASDTPFDVDILERIRKTTIRPPDYEGELVFDYEHSVVSEHDIKFLEQYGQNRLKWWGGLPFDRPDQKHNYIIGIDPSYGLGSSNSVLAVYDVNTKELCGIWADSTTDPVQLADITVALAYWCGGIVPTFVIWECNGGHGSNFTNRLVYNGYPWLYTQRREDSKTRKQTQKYGWSSNDIVKEKLLGDLGTALGSGVSTKPGQFISHWRHLIIHDENLLDELSDYVFKERGKGIVASSKADISTGALERHGDRVIATALCILGTREQVEGNFKDSVLPPPTSFMGRMKRWEQEQEQLKRNSRQFLY